MKTISIPKISLAGKSSSGSAPAKIKLHDGMKFGYSSNLDFLANVDTSEITDMSSMFKAMTAKSLDLSSLDTSSATNFSAMFASCHALTSLDLSSFDTSAVTTMSEMFSQCSKLTSLNLSSFDTSACTLMDYMFYICSELVSLDLSSFDTSSLRFFNRTFHNCPKIASLLLGPNFFKSARATSIDFSPCSAWVGDTVVTSLVTNSYDRASAGLGTLTLQLSTETKAALTDEQKAAITAKGYTIA